MTGLALLAAASPAAAATTVGQSSLSFFECADNDRATMESTGPPPAYAIPFDGVITSFTAYDVAGGDQDVKLLVLDGSGSTYTATAKSELAIFPAPGLHTFQTRLPARAGQRIGLYGSYCISFTDNTQDVARYESGPEPPLGVPLSYVTQSPSYRIILSAQLEPDADNDGFGDESQDCDSTDPARAEDCAAPTAQIVRGPPNRTTKKSTTFEFTGADARAIAGFRCKLDSGAFAPCASPLKLRVKKGKHSFQVQAIDQAGNVGSPATDDWKVKKKKRKK